MFEYEISFVDGNKKILAGENILSIVNYLLFECGYNSNEIIDIKMLGVN